MRCRMHPAGRHDLPAWGWRWAGPAACRVPPALTAWGKRTRLPWLQSSGQPVSCLDVLCCESLFPRVSHKDCSTVTGGRSARALLPALGTMLLKNIPAWPLAQRSVRAVLGTAVYLCLFALRVCLHILLCVPAPAPSSCLNKHFLWHNQSCAWQCARTNGTY